MLQPLFVYGKQEEEGVLTPFSGIQFQGRRQELVIL